MITGIIALVIGSLLVLFIQPYLSSANLEYHAYKSLSTDEEVSHQGQLAFVILAQRIKTQHLIYHLTGPIGFFLIGLGASLLLHAF